MITVLAFDAGLLVGQLLHAAIGRVASNTITKEQHMSKTDLNNLTARLAARRRQRPAASSRFTSSRTAPTSRLSPSRLTRRARSQPIRPRPRRPCRSTATA